MTPVEDLVKQWQELKRSPAAQRGEDLDSLRVLPHESLVLLAWSALNTLEGLEPFEYLRSILADHLEGPGAFQLGWVIAQADGGDNRGGFNKWCKAVGGLVFTGGEMCGDVMVYFTWKAAKEAFDVMYKDDPSVAACMRIYPVVISAGNEPRTTQPPIGMTHA